MEKKELLYEGKAKKVYTTEDENLYIVDYKDDATAGNGVKHDQFEGKGVLNNTISCILCIRNNSTNHRTDNRKCRIIKYISDAFHIPLERRYHVLVGIRRKDFPLEPKIKC